jgi:hypothetical protein
LHYDNRARYLYVISSPLEVEFELEWSSFKKLAVQFDRSLLLRCCEAADPRRSEITDTWDYGDSMCWELASVIRDECATGAPSGLLYTETAWWKRISGERWHCPWLGISWSSSSDPEARHSSARLCLCRPPRIILGCCIAGSATISQKIFRFRILPAEPA